MTQRERTLNALRKAGTRGMTQVDWLRFPTPDGGPPITRIAARIQELRDEGHEIQSSGTRDRCALYILREPGLVVAPTQAPESELESSTLFDPVSLHQPISPYEADAA